MLPTGTHKEDGQAGKRSRKNLPIIDDNRAPLVTALLRNRWVAGGIRNVAARIVNEKIADPTVQSLIVIIKIYIDSRRVGGKRRAGSFIHLRNMLEPVIVIAAFEKFVVDRDVR